MKAAQSFGVAKWAWLGTVAFSGRAGIWLPFLLVGGMRYLLLAVLVLFHRPLLLPFGLPLVRLLGGEAATHYPIFYHSLPLMYAKGNVFITVLVASIAAGAATLLFARSFGLGNRDPWRGAIRSAPALVLIALLVAILCFAVGRVASLFPDRLLQTSTAARWSARAATLVLLVLVQSMFGYATAWVTLMGEKIVPALRDSVRVSVRTLLPTILVIGLPLVLVYPIFYITSRIDLLAERLRPELIVALLSGQVLVETLATFLMVGGITRLFVWRMEAGQ